MAPTKKITVQEAREWVENALRNFDRDDFTKLDDALNGGGCEEFIDSFRPVKSKTQKKKSPSPKKEVVPDAPFDGLCCLARADKKDVMGFRINCQCTNGPRDLQSDLEALKSKISSVSEEMEASEEGCGGELEAKKIHLETELSFLSQCVGLCPTHIKKKASKKGLELGLYLSLIHI